MGDKWMDSVVAATTRGDHRVRAVQFVTASGWTRQAMEAEEKRERRRRQRQKVVSCCKKFAAFLFSHIGLAGMVVAYSIMGGFLFKWLEATEEWRQKVGIRDVKEDTVKAIAGESQRMCNDMINATVFQEAVRKALSYFQSKITVAITEHGWDGDDELKQDAVQWSFPGSLLYALTVITTIGYGHVAPKTATGRLVTILYAIVGIPLTFLYLSNIGNVLADIFRLFYKKICCDVLCCKKCERKKKRERLKLRRRRELAAQRNTILGVSEGMASYGAADDTVVAVSPNGSQVPRENSIIGLPGGGDNFAFEIEADDSDPEGIVSHCDDNNENESVERQEVTKTPDIELSDQSLLSLVNEDLRETAILDDDTESESEQLLSDAKPGTPTSEMHVSQTILDKLDDAKETAIIESEDDSKRVEEMMSECNTAEEVHASSDTEVIVPQRQTDESSVPVPCRSKSEKRPQKQKKMRSIFSSAKRQKRNPSKEKSKSKEKAAEKSKAGKTTEISLSKKEQIDPKKEAKIKEFEKNSLLLSSKAVSISDPQLAAKKQRDNEVLKLKKDQSRKGREKEKNSAAKDGHFTVRSRTIEALKRSASAKVIHNSQDSKQDSKGLHHTLPKSKSFQQSDDSFVTAHGDSFVQLNIDVKDDSESETELFTVHSGESSPNKIQESSNQLPQVEIPMDEDSVHPDDIELTDFNVLNDKLNFVDDPFDYEDDDSHDKVTVPISVCLILITGYIVSGALLFSFWEGWDLLTSSYFCFITLSTIGFGDIVPGTTIDAWDSNQKLVLCALWLAFGLSLLAMCFNLMQEEVKEKVKWVGHRIGLLKDEADS